MRKRKKRQKRQLSCSANFLKQRPARSTIRQQRFMTQHHAALCTGGARGINQARQVVGLHFSRTLLQQTRICLLPTATSQEILQRVVLQTPCMRPRSSIRPGRREILHEDSPTTSRPANHGRKRIQKFGVGHENAYGFAIKQNVPPVGRRRSRIQRRGQGADAHYGEVGNCPFRSILGKDCDPISRFHAKLLQCRCDGCDLVGNFLPSLRLIWSTAPTSGKQAWCVGFMPRGCKKRPSYGGGLLCEMRKNVVLHGREGYLSRVARFYRNLRSTLRQEVSPRNAIALHFSPRGFSVRSSSTSLTARDLRYATSWKRHSSWKCDSAQGSFVARGAHAARATRKRRSLHAS